jgi:hypothetical protein
MTIALRVLTILMAVAFLMNGLGFIFDPAAAAGGLGMEVLTGIGASTQLGDIGAYFIVLTSLIGAGQLHGRSHLLGIASLMLAAAAVMRTLVWLAGHADFATQFIIVEVVGAAVLFGAAHVRGQET